MKFALFILFFAASLSAEWNLDEMFCVAGIDNVKVSPDHQKVLFTSKKADLKKSEWTSQILVAKSDGTEVSPFTKKEGIALMPEWSPDGKSIVYLTKEKEKVFLHLISSKGGESERLTDGTNEVMAFKFSPDSCKLAVVMKECETADEKKRKEEKEDVIVVGENIKPNHLWILDLNDEKRALTRLSEGDFHIGTGFSGIDIDWSPDGKEIAFPRMTKPDLDLWNTSEIWIIDITTKQMRKLETDCFALTPKYSPDGKWIAFVGYSNSPRWDFTSDVEIISRKGGAPKKLAATPNSDYSQQGELIGWNSASNALYVIEASHTASSLYQIPIDGKNPIKLDFAGKFVEGVNLDAKNEVFGFVSESAERPREAFVKGVDEKKITQVSCINQSLPLDEIARTEVITYPSEDNLKIEALLTYPCGYEKGKKYPLLLVIHGGPTSLYQETFIGDPRPYPMATFASKGFAILRCNIRGSNGYGKEFRDANYRDWGGGDYRDLMRGVDYVIAQGIADPEKLGVMGWSYGGYMTAWIITQTSRFKAASVGAGVINLLSMAGTTDVKSFLPKHFGGELWNEFDLYLQRSAIGQIQKANTPTLIQHGQGDERVPLSQSYELYTALKRCDVPVKLVVYPRSGHTIEEPKLLYDAAKRNLEWFEKYLKNS